MEPGKLKRYRTWPAKNIQNLTSNKEWNLASNKGWNLASKKIQNLTSNKDWNLAFKKVAEPGQLDICTYVYSENCAASRIKLLHTLGIKAES
jgi:hypothetical protein